MSPLGVPEMRESARRSGGFAIRRQKRLDLFIADLQSAAVGFSCLLCAFSLEADCKSALNRSSLFCLRIANPQGRLAGLRLSLAPGGVASLPLGVPADLQSAVKKGSTSLSRICNPQP